MTIEMQEDEEVLAARIVNLPHDVKNAVDNPPTISGLIYPPAEIRKVVEKTAAFVAKNGALFEAKIRQNEIDNPKFKFLDPKSPFHAFYQTKIKQILEGNATPEAPSQPAAAPTAPIQKTAQEQFKVPEKIVLTDPPPESVFIIDPPTISSHDLDVVKQTAQFVARNGRQFLTNLMSRESRNFEFDFLRPQHNLFKYFTKLVEQYTKILLPSKDLVPKLKEELEDPDYLMKDVHYRVAWVKQQNLHRKREEDDKEKERIAYSQVNWHFFKIVGCVDPFDSTDLPPMIRPEDVGSRLIEEERCRASSEVEMQEFESLPSKKTTNNNFKGEASEVNPCRGADTSIQDMEEESDDEEGEGRHGEADVVPPLPMGVPDVLSTDKIIIRKDYNPKANRQTEASESEVFFTCPITKERVPAHKYSEHMRINLLDPKWTEQRDKSLREKKEELDIYADGSRIAENLKQLAEKRTDIFGFEEETEIGKSLGEEKRKVNPKPIWDGHSSSSEKVSQMARQHISIEDQIADIHKCKGLVDDEEKQKIGPSVIPSTVPNYQSHSTFTSVPQPPSFANGLNPVRPPVMGVLPLARPPKPTLNPPAPLGAVPKLPLLMGQPGVIPQIPLPRPPFMPPGGLIPGLPPMMPSMHVQLQGHVDEDEPAYKRAKLEESLIPEHEFLARNPSPVEFKVQLPMIDKSEWKLNGHMFPVTLPLSDTVSVIKAKIFDEVGMPAGKQKLQLDGMFLKDSNTLAYYNFNPNSVVILQLKERGGRKK